MPRIRKPHDPPSRSNSGSPLASPSEDAPASARRASAVSFVPFDVHSSSGVSSETRKAVRIQAAKASAAARKRTIARKLALQSSAIDDSQPASGPEEEIRRTLSATSLQSNVLEFPISPAASSARSVSASQLEPFNPYPVPNPHPQTSALVDYFLGYFTSEDTTQSPGRRALRKTLWPQALSDPALFHAILLNAGSHASVSGALTVSTELLSQLKHAAIESINDAIARSEARGGIGDSVIGAIALLGGWELEYGNADVYDTHMRGLVTIVNLRGGLLGANPPSSGIPAISPEVVDLILGTGHDLALYASKMAYFFDQPQEAKLDARHTPIPTGFAALIVQRLILPGLVDLVSRIARIVSIDEAVLLDLADIEQALGAWQLDTIMKASYSPFQTVMEDEMKRQISSCICLAGRVVCTYLRVATVPDDAQDKLGDLYDAALQLNADILVGTLYEEVAYWALFMTCSLTGRCEAQHMRVLKRLALGFEISDWFACRQALGRYAYSSAILDGRAYSLWEAIKNSTVARDTSTGLKEHSRLAKGVRHPTTYIGRAIAAEEG